MQTLTVIIPVYKVEDTLDRCIASVARQAGVSMEIILVDDGSPDRCPKMCDDWALKDSRIRVIHKPNGGLSDARNAALDIARGEYITFVDSDDYVADDTYKTVMESFGADIDIVEYPVWKFYGSPRQELLEFANATFDAPSDYWVRGKAYAHSYACNKIYRRRLFDGVRFPKGKIFEDTYTLPLLLEKARRIATADKGLYYYCDNPKGITATSDGYGLRHLLSTHVSRFSPIIDETYYLHVLNIQLDVCRMTGEKPILNELKITKPWKHRTKNGIKLLALDIVGLRALCLLYRLKYLMLKR